MIIQPEDALRQITELKTAYQLAFGKGSAVKADLDIFCRARMTCGVPGDHDRTWTLIGRNEVWLRIQQFLELTPEELLPLKTRPAEGATSHARSNDHD